MSMATSSDSADAGAGVSTPRQRRPDTVNFRPSTSTVTCSLATPGRSTVTTVASSAWCEVYDDATTVRTGREAEREWASARGAQRRRGSARS